MRSSRARLGAFEVHAAAARGTPGLGERLDELGSATLDAGLSAAEGARDYAALVEDLELFATATVKHFELLRRDLEHSTAARDEEDDEDDEVLDLAGASASCARVMLDRGAAGGARHRAETKLRDEMAWLRSRALGEGRLVIRGASYPLTDEITTPAELVALLRLAHAETAEAWRTPGTTPYSTRALGVALAALARGDVETSRVVHDLFPVASMSSTATGLRLGLAH